MKSALVSAALALVAAPEATAFVPPSTSGRTADSVCSSSSLHASFSGSSSSSPKFGLPALVRAVPFFDGSRWAQAGRGGHTPDPEFTRRVAQQRSRLFSTKIRQLADEHSPEAAIEALQDMLEVAQCEPSEEALMAVALSCARAGQPAKALSLLEVLDSRSSVMSVKMYTPALIKALQTGNTAAVASLDTRWRRSQKILSADV